MDGRPARLAYDMPCGITMAAVEQPAAMSQSSHSLIL
jgi:hypothetical protein